MFFDDRYRCIIAMDTDIREVVNTILGRKYTKKSQ